MLSLVIVALVLLVEVLCAAALGSSQPHVDGNLSLPSVPARTG